MEKKLAFSQFKKRRDVLKKIAMMSAATIGGSLLFGDSSATPVATNGGMPGYVPPKVKLIGSRAKNVFHKSIKGEVIWFGEKNYEGTRGAAVYRSNKPKRFPAVIVLPRDDQDVVRAVLFAKANGLRVGRRSGGHSWTSPHIRDNTMLIDLSMMQEMTVDPVTQTIWTNPSVVAGSIIAELGAHGLITPTAHHPTVGIGGFAMCGGFGWNSRLWGNGSAHIQAIDVVTADGELIRADETQNQDYLWAARGAGAGFFGVVTRMQLTAHPLPKVIKASVHVYGTEDLEELFTWARNIVPQMPPYVEMVIVSSAHDTQGNWAPVTLTMAALALTDDEALADAGLAILETCPIVSKAKVHKVGFPTTIAARHLSGYNADPAGNRFSCDNMYTNAAAEELVPKLRRLFTDLPTPRSHVFWLNWGPTKQFPDMALSIQGEVFLGAYGIWTDPNQDESMDKWPVEQFRPLMSMSVGGQMNDENMLGDPQRYLSHDASRRLEQYRAKYDPTGVFLSYLRKDTL